MKKIALLMMVISMFVIGCTEKPETLKQPFMSDEELCQQEGALVTNAIPTRFLYVIHAATGKVLMRSTVRGSIITSTRCIRVDAWTKYDLRPFSVGHFINKYEYIADIRPTEKEHSAFWITGKYMTEMVDLHKGDVIHVSGSPLAIRHGIARLPEIFRKHR